ncbi:MAG: MFS transporter [Gemmatimonadaceae bacterium]
MTDEAPVTPPAVGWRAIPRGIWALGFVSLLMDISSEMIHSLLPIYMVTILGASAITIGVLEGVAEATASVTKVFSGVLSDWFGKRKLLAVIGYGLAALTKPIFPLAPSIDWLIGARLLDRVGKGIRGAPRDALVADISPAHLRGASFGLRQSLDTIGAFFGPLLAIGLMWVTADNFRRVFWVAVVPALLSVAVLLFAVKEPERPNDVRQVRMPLRREELRRLGAAYWKIVAVAGVFTLARFSEAFLILRAQSIGLPVKLAPAVLVLMSLAYSLSAYPVGVISDRVNKVTILVTGLAVLVAANLVLASSTGLVSLSVGVVLWGLHMGFTQGLLATMIAGTSPPELRGTAFGVFNLVTGLTLLASSVIAGILWQTVGPQYTFLAGALFAGITIIVLSVVRPQS